MLIALQTEAPAFLPWPCSEWESVPPNKAQREDLTPTSIPMSNQKWPRIRRCLRKRINNWWRKKFWSWWVSKKESQLRRSFRVPCRFRKVLGRLHNGWAQRSPLYIVAMALETKSQRLPQQVRITNRHTLNQLPWHLLRIHRINRSSCGRGIVERRPRSHRLKLAM